MNHLSIAIIRRKSEANDHFDYLVIAENESVKCFDSLNRAIGGSFDFTSFKKQIIKYFDLPETTGTDTSTPVDFEVPPTLFKSSKRNPEATAYLYELSKVQFESVNNCIQRGEGKWVNVKWISESALKVQPWKANQRFVFERESSFRPPQFTNEFRASVKKIVSAKNDGKLVIFAGAGVSLDSQVPGWGALIDELSNDLTTTETDFLKVADLYYQTRGEKEYHERVQEILKHGKTKYNPIHRKITELNPVHIVTTNYDTHFEQILENKGLPYSVVRADKDLPYSKGSSLYVKMHGDFGLRNIVLRESDYSSYEKQFSLIQSFIRETFASKLVLFVGFSFSDVNLRQILHSVKEILEHDIQQPYLFSSLDSLQPMDDIRVDLQRQGVRLLEYDIAIDDYFSQIKNSDDDEALKQLTSKGQSVYKFLKVIEEFDIVSDSLENQKIENQFIHSLERFKELGSIPVPVLCTTIPFKIKHHPKGHEKGNAEFNYYDPFHLEVLNEDLLAFLQGRKNQDDKIDFKTYRDATLHDAEQDLNRYLKLLYTSGVHCIKRKSDTESIHFSLNPINDSDRQCDCLRCLDSRLDLKKLIYSLNSTSAQNICKRDFHDEGLLEAYGFLKTGQIIKTFYALEEVRRESLKSEHYITYFLACYNQSLLPPLIRRFYETNYDETESERITEKIGSLDLYKILNNLPIARDIRHCMQLIMENNVYTSMLGKMEDEFEDIKNAYNDYMRPGFNSSGPNYWYRFQAYFHLTWNFHYQNLLYTDEKYSFSKMAYLYLEGMIVSYCTSNRYKQRLSEFPLFFVSIFIQYGYPNDLTKLLKQYGVVEIKIQGGLSEIIEEFQRFLEAGVDRSSIFGDSISQDGSYQALVESSTYFRNRIIRTFNNFLILLTHVPLYPVQVNDLVRKVVDFLSVSEVFNASDSHKSFSDFVKHYIESIDDDNIQKLGFYFLSDNIWSGSVILPFCNALITVRKAEHIFNEEFYVKLSRRIEQRMHWTVGINGIVPFYVLLKPEQQKKFLKLFSDAILEAPDRRWDFLNTAYHWRVWDPVKNPDTFEEFSAHVFALAEKFPAYRISDDGDPIGANFQPWNDMYIFVHMVYSYNLFHLPIVSKIHDTLVRPLFKWILKPNEFEYDSFKIEWLLVFSNPLYLNVLKLSPKALKAVDEGLKMDYNPKVAEIFHTILTRP